VISATADSSTTVVRNIWIGISEGDYWRRNSQMN
jgi:hypothetical protein